MTTVCREFADFASASRVECPEQPEAIKQTSASAAAAIANGDLIPRIALIRLPLPGSVRDGVEAILVIDGLGLWSLQEGQPLRRDRRMGSVRHHTTGIGRRCVLIRGDGDPLNGIANALLKAYLGGPG